MANYISSHSNRFYAAVETAFGQAVAVSAQNRFPASKLSAHQTAQQVKRLDKTGSRSYLGQSSLSRRNTTFEVQSYLAGWNATGAPAYGPLFQAGLGTPPSLWAGAVVASLLNATEIVTQSAHGLAIGSAVALGGEIRFVTSTSDPLTFVVNAPFSASVQAGTQLGPTVTYRLGAALPSVTLYDYWDPASAVSLVITGASVNQLGIRISGDYHTFSFAGVAADLLDSQTPIVNALSGLSAFPSEPSIMPLDLRGVPGHLGQAWIGTSGQACLTLTEASIQIHNNVELRHREFGAIYPSAVVPGPRDVSANFSVLAQDDAQSHSLYVAAKQRSQIPFMLQLGIQQLRLMGVYMPAVTPELPDFNDSGDRLEWKFSNSLAQGVADDELVIGFA